MAVELVQRFEVQSAVAASFTRRLSVNTYDYVYVWVTIEALVGSPTTATFDLNVQAADPIQEDGPSTAPWVDIPGSAIAQLNQASSLPSSQCIVLGPEQLVSNNMRLNCAVAFSGGTSPGWTTTITLVPRLK